jgi:hypothetical protein
MSDQANYTVARNECFTRSGIGTRERHNERRNGQYDNTAIDPERLFLNHFYARCEGTYEQALDKMLRDKTISDRGLIKAEANYFGELIFDVNTMYFDEHGGYEFAKRFYEEAYRYAEKKVGAEYILSAVMHADEVHQGELADTGEKKYHYHLHVVYIPVVKKEVRYSKRNKNPELRSKVKETINQISASKKWEFSEAIGDDGQPLRNKNGKIIKIPSYTVLQDEFFEHMFSAGYEDFERGERGSNAEHLTMTEYKTKKERERLVNLGQRIEEESEKLEELVGACKEAVGYIDYSRELLRMGRLNQLTGLVEITESNYHKLTSLATVSLNTRKTIESLNAKVETLTARLNHLTEKVKTLFDETKWYRVAEKLAPKKMKESISKIFKADRDKAEKLTRQEEHRFGQEMRQTIPNKRDEHMRMR